MNTLIEVLALLLTALPIVAQTKTLVAKNRTPIAVAGDYPHGFALPTTCDDQERLYIKLFEAGQGMKGPLFRLSNQGVVEAKFDTSGELINRYAAGPDGGVIMIHSDGSGKFIDNFAPDGTRESSVALERPPVPFFPSQLAVFNSGEILLSGLQYRPGYKASTAIFDPRGRLVKQLVLDGDVVIESAISNDTRAQQQNTSTIDTSVAITGDDGLVYLMRPSPCTVYAISSAGEVVHQIVVRAPSGKASARCGFGIRVGKNRLVVQFSRNAYTVVDATTGEQLATYESDKEATGTMACFVPDPDRFLIFSQNKHGLDIVEAEPK
jgi:hypothetical protein